MHATHCRLQRDYQTRLSNLQRLAEEHNFNSGGTSDNEVIAQQTVVSLTSMDLTEQVQQKRLEGQETVERLRANMESTKARLMASMEQLRVGCGQLTCCLQQLFLVNDTVPNRD